MEKLLLCLNLCWPAVFVHSGEFLFLMLMSKFFKVSTIFVHFRTVTDLQFLDHVVRVHRQMGGNKKSDMLRKFICRCIILF